MFDQLSDKLNGVVKTLKGQGKIKESNIEEALKEVRISLLEADVNYEVVKNFIEDVKEKALGEKVLNSVSPAQQFIKIVYDELVEILGGEASLLSIAASPPVIIMLVGLQGSGKTTTAAKIGQFLKKKNKRTPLLVPLDVYRPAAIEQLKILGKKAKVTVFDTDPSKNPVDIALEARDYALMRGYDTVILDTAGRLHIDDELMKELENVKEAVKPEEIILIADSMTGQDAVNIATEFNNRLDITGVILTKTDGDTRGGAALSIKAVTGKPIKMVGTGEKFSDIEIFHPDRIASRILDMGDIVTLVEKAQESVDQDKAQELAEKMMKNQYTMDDFLEHIQQIKKMGPLENLMKMIPGAKNMMRQIKNFTPPDKELKKIEAIISSMTKEERQNHGILNASRRNRIAKGSGTTIQDVNKVIRSFNEMRKMMRRFTKKGKKGIPKGMMPF